MRPRIGRYAGTGRVEGPALSPVEGLAPRRLPLYPQRRMTPPAGPLRTTLGILLILWGVVGFTIYLVTGLTKVFGGMERIEVPGTRELNLERGDYTVYWETDSRLSRAPDRADLELAVVSQEGDFRPSVSSGLVRSQYTTMSRVAVSVAEFTAPQKGPYTITVGARAGKTLPRGGITVSRSMGFLGLIKLVGGCILLLGGGVGGGVALIVRRPKPA